MVLRRNAPNSFQSYPALLSLQPQVLRIKAFDTGSDAALFLPSSALLKIKAPKANTAQLLNPVLMNPLTWLYIHIGRLFMHVCKWQGGEVLRNRQLSIGPGAVCQADDCSCCCRVSVGVGSKQPAANSAATMGARLGGLPAVGEEKDV